MDDTVEQSGLQRRDQILLAAKACFVRKGFHQTSMQDICHEARMSIGNLYRYFESKEAIIEASVEQELQWMSQAIEEVPATENLVQAIHDTVIWTASTLMHDGEAEITAELFAEAGRNPRVNAIYVKFNKQLIGEIVRALENIEMRQTIEPRHSYHDIAMALISLVDGMVMHKLVNPEFDLLKHRPVIETMVEALLGATE